MTRECHSLQNGSYVGPEYRIGLLDAAHKEVWTITPGRLVTEAITTMLAQNFSRLLVATGAKISGMISWRSIATSRACGHLPSAAVHECVEPHYEVNEDASLFDAIPIIAENDYVLIRSRENRIAGIVTATDLSLEFKKRAEPFLLLKDIELSLRDIARPHLSRDELKKLHLFKDDEELTVDALTLGELIAVFTNQEFWPKLQISDIDRITLRKSLLKIGRIRNDVMHFRKEGTDLNDLATLLNFSKFIQGLCRALSALGSRGANPQPSNSPAEVG